MKTGFLLIICLVAGNQARSLLGNTGGKNSFPGDIKQREIYPYVCPFCGGPLPANTQILQSKIINYHCITSFIFISLLSLFFFN